MHCRSVHAHDVDAHEIHASLHFLPSSSQKSSAHTDDGPTTSSTAAASCEKKYPWKNVPSWSPLRRELQQHSTTRLHNPTVDALRSGTDSLGSPMTQFELPQKESRAFVAEQREISSEIPETPPVALENVGGKEDDHSEDGNTLSCIGRWWTETDRT
jgi:hypothetical protein